MNKRITPAQLEKITRARKHGWSIQLVGYTRVLMIHRKSYRASKFLAIEKSGKIRGV